MLLVGQQKARHESPMKPIVGNLTSWLQFLPEDDSMAGGRPAPHFE
jgi:hypothetical protein